MLTDKELLSFINDKSLDGSLEENLNRIIDEEMEKSEEEMDTELIEYCLDKLSKLEAEIPDTEAKKGNGDSNGKFIKFNFKKVIAIVAAILILLVGTLSVSAVVFNVNLFDGFVELYSSYCYYDQYNESNSKNFEKAISAPKGYTYRVVCEHYAKKPKLVIFKETETSYNVTSSLVF